MSKEAKSKNYVKLEEYSNQFVALLPTEKNKYHPQGKVFKVHPDVAKRFIAKGVAEEAPEDYEEESSED